MRNARRNGTLTEGKETVHVKIMHHQAGNETETDAAETANKVRTTRRRDGRDGLESPGTAQNKPAMIGMETSGGRRTARRVAGIEGA